MKELMKLDLYELLNIRANAIDSEIKKAYRKKALTCHPDKNPDNPRAVEDFKQLSKAVEILTDRVKRADYDRVLRARKAANAKRVSVRITKIPPSSHAARGKEETRKSKEERKSECPLRKHPKTRTPTWPPAAAKSQDKKENGPRQNANPKRESPHRKKAAPTWPPSASKAQTKNEGIPRQNMKKDSPHRKDTKRTVPTWPPSASNAQTNSEDGSRQNMSFKWNFSSILKPAMFVAPTMQDGSADAPFPTNLCFAFANNQNVYKAYSVPRFSPLIRPATFVAPSDNNASTGNERDSPHRNKAAPTWPPSASKAQTQTEGDPRQNMSFNWGQSSSILKPATFTATSKN